jgi:hypothetical protein
MPNSIFIPSYIGSVDFQPARVLPRIFFYNGLKDCDPYYISSGSQAIEFEQFPYFDNYSGEETTEDSLSLLFFNETAPYGEIPKNSLFTENWSEYVALLYNPRTRIVNCEAIIPLADYFVLELNTLVQFRGNTYHLRYINDYNLNTGECKVQLLGPISDTTFGEKVPLPTQPGELPAFPELASTEPQFSVLDGESALGEFPDQPVALDEP